MALVDNNDTVADRDTSVFPGFNFQASKISGYSGITFPFCSLTRTDGLKVLVFPLSVGD